MCEHAQQLAAYRGFSADAPAEFCCRRLPILDPHIPYSGVKPPQDCELSDWSDWTTCSASCGGGETTRERKVITEPLNGGKTCGSDEPLKEIKGCNEQVCHAPQDCSMSDWSAWGPCSAECDGGEQERTRHVTLEAEFGGKLCDSAMRELRGCNEQSCVAPQDCAWGKLGRRKCVYGILDRSYDRQISTRSLKTS